MKRQKNLSVRMRTKEICNYFQDRVQYVSKGLDDVLSVKHPFKSCLLIIKEVNYNFLKTEMWYFFSTPQVLLSKSLSEKFTIRVFKYSWPEMKQLYY